MEKQRGIRTLSIVALFVAVIGLSVAFAAMSRTLQINGTATMDTAKWDIHFENLAGPGVGTAEAKGTGAATVEVAPEIKADASGIAATVIGDYKVTLTKPGDSVTYTFDVVNEGTINAKIGTFTKTAPSCAPATEVADGDVAATADDAALVCRNLTYTLTYDNGDAVAADDTLAANETKHMVLKLIYNDEATELPTANTDVEITGLDITMVYVQD